MLNIADPVEAFDFDCALALACEAVDAEVLETAAQDERGGPFGLLLALLATRL